MVEASIGFFQLLPYFFDSLAMLLEGVIQIDATCLDLVLGSFDHEANRTHARHHHHIILLTMACCPAFPGKLTALANAQNFVEPASGKFLSRLHDVRDHP